MTPFRRKTALALLLWFLASVEPRLYAQTSTAVNTVFSIVQQEHCPMKILSVRQTVTDYLTASKIRNQTLKEIDTFRIGWVAIFANGAPKVSVGRVLHSEKLKPGEVAIVRAQKIAPLPGATEIRYFIAETTWEGGSWKQDLREIESQLTPTSHHGAVNYAGDSPGR